MLDTVIVSSRESHIAEAAKLTEAQADALLRKDLRKFCALYSKYGKDSVLLGCVSLQLRARSCQQIINSEKNSAVVTETSSRNTPPTAATKANSISNSTNAG